MAVQENVDVYLDSINNNACVVLLRKESHLPIVVIIGGHWSLKSVSCKPGLMNVF